jgi:hypothetical protein
MAEEKAKKRTIDTAQLSNEELSEVLGGIVLPSGTVLCCPECGCTEFDEYDETGWVPFVGHDWWVCSKCEKEFKSYEELLDNGAHANSADFK